MVSQLIGVLSRLSVCSSRLKLGFRELEFFHRSSRFSPKTQLPVDWPVDRYTRTVTQNLTNGRLAVDRKHAESWVLQVGRLSGRPTHSRELGFSMSVDCPVDRHTAVTWLFHSGRLAGRPPTPVCTLCTSVDCPVDRTSEICCC